MYSGGYVLSAIFICWEFQRLGVKFRSHPILRVSFWIKLLFIFVEVGLAIGKSAALTLPPPPKNLRLPTTHSFLQMPPTNPPLPTQASAS